MNIINIGSKNSIKVESVTETLEDYDFLKPFSVRSMDVLSDISSQPTSIDEVVIGAKNRARNSFMECNYSFGIESGLIQFPGAKTGYLEACVCAIYDNRNFYVGMSCAFELPREIVKLIIEQGRDLGQATKEIGLTENEDLGSAEGIVGLLTKNRVTRKQYIAQAIQMALISLENIDLYY